MDPQQSLYTNDQELQKSQRINSIKEKIYQFFYAIWPSVNRVLSFFFYHLLRIIKGFFKVALEQFQRGG
jgi:hypothetical protein